MAGVLLAVVGLLEGTQHKGGIRLAAVPAPRGLAPGEPARLRRHLAGGARRQAAAQRRRRHVERRQLLQQVFDPRRVGLRVDAVDRRHPPRRQQLGDLLVGHHHQPLDQPVGLGLGDAVGGGDVALGVEARTRARTTRRRGWSCRGARRARRRRRGRRPAVRRPPPAPAAGRRRSRRAGRSRGGRRSGCGCGRSGRGRGGRRRRARSPPSPPAARPPAPGCRPRWRARAAASARPRRGRRCCCPAAAPPGRAASRAARGRRRRRCGPRPRARSPSRWAETASSKSRALAGSTVKVASAVRSRRGPGIALDPLRRPRRLDLEPGLEAAKAEPLAQQQLDRVAGGRRLAAAAAAAAARAAAAPPGGPAPPARLTPSAQAPA